ncbi:SDR family NAD(P)-dependent oxidoreductase [Aeromicrobium sp.]|uniref:SDR family NAD(P)-dependent oxidoreductase n=1 Tax=Aeromicrobium sp. TaxID=1871063 RepID=UPI003C6A3388
MDLGLRDRVVWVSGASGVIGASIAEAFGAEGARVVVGFHLREDAAGAVAARVEGAGGSARTAHLELDRPDGVREALDELDPPWSDVEILVNSAVSWPEPSPAAFDEIPLETVRASVETNLLGTLAVTQQAVASMRRRGWGRVIHLSTGLVEDGFAGSTPYTTAKSALHGLTRTMSRELAATGILVNTVLPGYVPHGHEPAELLEQVSRSAATRSTTSPADVAALVTYLASPRNGAVTGELIRADGHFLTRD